MITRNITGPRIQELFPKGSDPGTGEFVRAIGKFGLKGIRLACLRSLSLWKTARYLCLHYFVKNVNMK